MNNTIINRLKKFTAEDAHSYADSVTNTFITGQIKALREDRGLTQEELAGLVGTKQSGISRWQNTGYSGCKVDTLRKFARAFGVRLRISFEEFGTLPTDVGGFNKEKLCPHPFSKDPVLFPERKRELLVKQVAASAPPPGFFYGGGYPESAELNVAPLGETVPAGEGSLWSEQSAATVLASYGYPLWNNLPTLQDAFQALHGAAFSSPPLAIHQAVDSEASVSYESPVADQSHQKQTVPKGPAALFVMTKRPTGIASRSIPTGLKLPA